LTGHHVTILGAEYGASSVRLAWRLLALWIYMVVLTFGWSNADIQQARRRQAQNNHMLSSVMAY